MRSARSSEISSSNEVCLSVCFVLASIGLIGLLTPNPLPINSLLIRANTFSKNRAVIAYAHVVPQHLESKDCDWSFQWFVSDGVSTAEVDEKSILCTPEGSLIGKATMRYGTARPWWRNLKVSWPAIKAGFPEHAVNLASDVVFIMRGHESWESMLSYYTTLTTDLQAKDLLFCRA
jgi:hypothetical protein